MLGERKCFPGHRDLFWRNDTAVRAGWYSGVHFHLEPKRPKSDSPKKGGEIWSFPFYFYVLRRKQQHFLRLIVYRKLLSAILPPHFLSYTLHAGDLSEYFLWDSHTIFICVHACPSFSLHSIPWLSPITTPQRMAFFLSGAGFCTFSWLHLFLHILF